MTSPFKMLALSDRTRDKHNYELDVQTKYQEVICTTAHDVAVIVHNGERCLQVVKRYPLGPSVDGEMAEEIEALIEGWSPVRVPAMVETRKKGAA